MESMEMCIRDRYLDMYWELYCIWTFTVYGWQCALNGVQERLSLLGDLKAQNGRSINWYNKNDIKSEDIFLSSLFCVNKLERDL